MPATLMEIISTTIVTPELMMGEELFNVYSKMYLIFKSELTLNAKGEMVTLECYTLGEAMRFFITGILSPRYLHSLSIYYALLYSKMMDTDSFFPHPAGFETPLKVVFDTLLCECDVTSHSFAEKIVSLGPVGYFIELGLTTTHEGFFSDPVSEVLRGVRFGEIKVVSQSGMSVWEDHRSRIWRMEQRRASQRG